MREPREREQVDAAVQERYHLFRTHLGACGIAWSERGVTRLQLPEGTSAATERRLRARPTSGDAGEPPAPVRRVVAMMGRYFAGERVDFSSIVLDLHGVGAFYARIYQAARELDWGQTATYGDLARQAGSPGAARAVGQAMG